MDATVNTVSYFIVYFCRFSATFPLQLLFGILVFPQLTPFPWFSVSIQNENFVGLIIT